MKTLLLAVVAIGSFACASSAPTGGEPTSSAATGGEPVMCTQEAKLCADGSAVGRTGPNCEFAPCPGGDGPAPSATPTTEPIPPG